jgi:hypothetical protein
MKPILLISCHADTGFKTHRLSIDKNGSYFGHLDNFIGVYAVMQAYFSGKMNYGNTRIELTYGEEDGMEGAYKVLKSLHKNDVAIVVDVTGIPTKKDITIEKCSNKWMKNFIIGALAARTLFPMKMKVMFTGKSSIKCAFSAFPVMVAIIMKKWSAPVPKALKQQSRLLSGL